MGIIKFYTKKKSIFIIIILLYTGSYAQDYKPYKI